MAAFSVTNSTIPAGTAAVANSTNYGVLIAVAASSGNNGNAFTNAQALKRGKLYDILIGTNTSPADNFIEYDVCRATMGTTVTWLGSVSSVSSAYMLDVADAGFGSLVLMNTSSPSTSVGTPVAEVWYVGVNQRASYRWVAAPGSELVWPANSSGTGNNSLQLRSRAGGFTGTCTGTVLCTEN